MTEPQTDAEALLEDRKLTNPLELLKMVPSTNASSPPTSLVEAYKKHAAELAGIEDRQYKLTLLMLGIFSAGLTWIASGHVDLTHSVRWSLIVFSLVIVIPNCYYNWELHHLRGVTRELLVRCEIALGFHAQNLFLKDEKLYALLEIAYSKRGQYLRNSFYYTVVPACLAFVLIVAFVRLDAPPAVRDCSGAAKVGCSVVPSQAATQK